MAIQYLKAAIKKKKLIIIIWKNETVLYGKPIFPSFIGFRMGRKMNIEIFESYSARKQFWK